MFLFFFIFYFFFPPKLWAFISYVYYIIYIELYIYYIVQYNID